MDEVLEKCSLENPASDENPSAALGKGLLRPRFEVRRILRAEMALRPRQSGAGGPGETVARLAVSGGNPPAHGEEVAAHYERRGHRFSSTISL